MKLGWVSHFDKCTSDTEEDHGTNKKSQTRIARSLHNDQKLLNLLFKGIPRLEN